MISLAIGYIADLLIGDPKGMWHPVRLIGKLTDVTELKLRKKCNNKFDERKAGIILWFIVTGLSFIVPLMILVLAAWINKFVYIVVSSVMCYYILAVRSLRDESMNVYRELKNNNIPMARKYLSYIVGRDVDKLTEESIAKAAVETVAENTSDGVIAPMIFIIIGGAPLGFLYKAINTLDSMVGYKNEKYIDFGRFSALADDVANFIPARLSSYLIMLSALILGMDYRNSYKIYKRDKYNHLSPNSAHTEAACAGALNIMLGGSNFYGGKLVSKPTIGDDIKPIEIEDIKRANKLMYIASFVCIITGMILKYIVVTVI